MDNTNTPKRKGFGWTLGILIIIFAALFTLAIVFNWFGWRDGEPKDRVEPITPEMVADGEVAPGASVEQLPEGELVEKIPSVTEADGSVIVPGNPKIKEVLDGKALLIDEDGVKSLQFVEPVVLQGSQASYEFSKGDVITDLKIKHDVIESGTIKTVGGQITSATGLNIKI